MDRRLLWHWTSDLFKLNFLVHNPPPCKNQKQKSQTKGSLKREFIVVRSGCRSRVTLKQKGETVSYTAQAQARHSVECGQWWWLRLCSAACRRGSPRHGPARTQSCATPYFHSLVTAPGLPSGDTAPLVTSPRITHLTGELNLSLEHVKHKKWSLRIKIDRRPRDGRP